MARSPNWKVYNPQGDYVAACKHLEDAACLAGLYGHGATVRSGHAYKDCIWKEGHEEFSASESFDRAADLMLDRLTERVEARRKQFNERFPLPGEHA